MAGEGNYKVKGGKKDSGSDNHRLFIALTEQLKTPLTQIARASELAKTEKYQQESLSNIESSVKAALNLIDNYLLNSEMKIGQQKLLLQPLSAQLVLQEAAHELEPLAQQYNCELVVKNIGRKCPPVMANSEGLKAAITSLASVFIESSQNLSKKKRQVNLITQKQQDGILAGVFSRANGFNAKSLADGQILYGRAKMPFPSVSNSGAGVFIAQSLLDALSAQLKFSRYSNLQGLGALLPISKQLKLKVL